MLPNLAELGTGLYALVHPTPRYGSSNAGLILDADGGTVIDTGATPLGGVAVRSEIERLIGGAGLPLRRCVITSSRIPYSGGSSAFVQLAFFGSPATSAELDSPLNRTAIGRLLPHLADAYDESFTTRPITHEVSDETWVTPSTQLAVVPGESDQNLVAVCPDAAILFGGALASFGVTPLAYSADLEAWAASLRALAELATTVVPGHGPVGGPEDLRVQADYLLACVAANGSIGRLVNGPWDGWTNREFDVVNVERAARLSRGDASIPASFLELLGLT